MQENVSQVFFTVEELDLLRQWYNALQDTNPAYLDSDGFKDTELYEKIKAALGKS
ncbi:hypothetical protein ACM55O_18130 [Hafnia paralvei]|uniref:hypothetical protein n=1 Tax=Hafnia paralvei TaxID=546367 RepID=UPI0039FCD7D9